MVKNNEIEGLILLLDVGESMMTQLRSDSPDTTYLQNAVDIIQMIIQRKMFQQSSGDELALILFATNETANELAYSHVSVARSLSPVDWPLLDFVQNKIECTRLRGDILDALVVSSNHFKETANIATAFTTKRIIVLTDFSCSTESEDKLDEITNAFLKNSIRVDVISPFSDHFSEETEEREEEEKIDKDEKNDQARASNSSSNETRPEQQKAISTDQQRVKEMLGKLCTGTDGAQFSFNEALKLLSVYQAKSVRSTGTKYTLTIGDSFKLPIVSMLKCKEHKPDLFKLKKVYGRDSSIQLQTDRSRFTKDAEQRELDTKTECLDAYRYGSSYVPIDNVNEVVTLKAEKCFSVLGFTKSSNVKRHYFVGDSVNQILPDEALGGDQAQEAFVNMVQAMYLDDVYGIVRRVYSSRSSPELAALVPCVENQRLSLLYVKLPFEDDVRKFTLENFACASKFEPNQRQLDAVDSLIDSMTLSRPKKEEEKEKRGDKSVKEGEEEEEEEEEEEPYDPQSTFNPYIQRMFQSIALRASNPEDELPDFEKHITSTHLTDIGKKFKKSEKTKQSMKRIASEFRLVVNEKKVKVQAENMFFSKGEEEDKNSENKKDEKRDDDKVTESNGEKVETSSDENETVSKKPAVELDDEDEDLLDLM